MAKPAHASTPIESDIQIEHWPIDRLIPRATNPRTHSREQVANIAASIREWGWTNPILVGADNDIIAGHARVLAARKLEMEEVPVIVLRHLSLAQRRALVIADNQLAIAGAGWDEETLRIELATLHEEDYNLDLVGFDDVELARLLEQQDIGAGLTDEDAVPEVQEESVARTGDVFCLGNHRIICGDCTTPDVVARLLGDARPLVLITDPPYGIELDSEWRDRAGLNGCGRAEASYMKHRVEGHTETTISGDTRATGPKLCAAAGSPGGLRLACIEVHERGPRWAAANRLPASSTDHLGQGPDGAHAHALLVPARTLLVRPKKERPLVRQGLAKIRRSGIHRRRNSLWADRRKRSVDHPTQKPVELMRRPILNHTLPGESIYDCFLGSGTTLVAAEQTGARLLRSGG